MFRPYRAVLSSPGALAFSAAGLLGRLPISMYGIGVVLLVVGTGGSYALAGAVSATFGLTSVGVGPLVARLFDRFGQARVLRPLAVVHVAGLVALVACAGLGAPAWTLFPVAVLGGGAVLQVGSLVRARWTALLGAGPGLGTAFSLESVVDEIIFIVGPIVVTVLATRAAPEVGLLVAAGAALSGALALARLRRTEPTTDPTAPRGGGSALRSVPLRIVALTFVAVGGIFGSVEVIAVAFTAERGRPGLAGVVLALFAFGSMVAGLAWGTVHWQGPGGRRFVVAVVLLAVGVVPFALATSILVLALVMAVAGLAISPMIVSGFGLVEETVPNARLTEGLTWATTGVGLGVAIGAGAAGFVIDAAGARPAFVVTLACGASAATIVLLGARPVLAARRPDAVVPVD